MIPQSSTLHHPGEGLITEEWAIPTLSLKSPTEYEFRKICSEQYLRAQEEHYNFLHSKRHDIRNLFSQDGSNKSSVNNNLIASKFEEHLLSVSLKWNHFFVL